LRQFSARPTRKWPAGLSGKRAGQSYDLSALDRGGKSVARRFEALPRLSDCRALADAICERSRSCIPPVGRSERETSRDGRGPEEESWPARLPHTVRCGGEPVAGTLRARRASGLPYGRTLALDAYSYSEPHYTQPSRMKITCYELMIRPTKLSGDGSDPQ
jgi:hypothetical protein